MWGGPRVGGEGEWESQNSYLDEELSKLSNNNLPIEFCTYLT